MALLLIDGVQGVTAQDAHIAGYVLEAYKSVVVLVNKWDIVEKDTQTMVEYTREVRADLKFLDYVPVLFISALTKQRVQKVLPTALTVAAERRYRIPTAELNGVIQDAYHRSPPATKKLRPLRIYYATQASVDPPTFVLFVNDPELAHFSYLRYLENQPAPALPVCGHTDPDSPAAPLLKERLHRRTKAFPFFCFSLLSPHSLSLICYHSGGTL